MYKKIALLTFMPFTLQTMEFSCLTNSNLPLKKQIIRNHYVIKELKNLTAQLEKTNETGLKKREERIKLKGRRKLNAMKEEHEKYFSRFNRKRKSSFSEKNIAKKKKRRIN